MLALPSTLGESKTCSMYALRPKARGKPPSLATMDITWVVSLHISKQTYRTSIRLKDKMKNAGA